jgi:hypothetical protein
MLILRVLVTFPLLLLEHQHSSRHWACSIFNESYWPFTERELHHPCSHYRWDPARRLWLVGKTGYFLGDVNVGKCEIWDWDEGPRQAVSLTKIYIHG